MCNQNLTAYLKLIHKITIKILNLVKLIDFEANKKYYC